MADLAKLASELQVSDRTLRRAVSNGLIRAHREGPRRTRVTVAERRYLRHAWPLLSRLADALRTEPNVRLAVVFGSVARGDDRPDSDLDLMVVLHNADQDKLYDLQERIARRIGRRVQILTLSRAEREPSLLADVLRDGRVIVDREGRWRRLVSREPQLRRDGEDALDERARRVLARIARLGER